MEKEIKELNRVDEKTAREKSGWGMLALVILLYLAAIASVIVGIVAPNNEALSDVLGIFVFLGIALFIVAIILTGGFKLLQPNEAYVFTLFGKYYGTLKRDGFFWVNPFCSAVNPARFSMGSGRKLSLKAMTLNNDQQKVNYE